MFVCGPYVWALLISMKFGLICYGRINMKIELIYCLWVNWKLVNLDLLLYCIWWLIWDIWIISIAYCLFGLGPIVNWLCVWPYWIGLEMLFPLAMYIIDVGLLIDMNFWPTMWVRFVGWFEYLIWAWPIWII